MATFTIKNSGVKAIVSLDHATVQSRTERHLTPIMAGIKVAVGAQFFTAMATDRYIAAEVKGSLEQSSVPEAEECEFLVDSKEWVALGKAVGAHDVTFTLEDGALTAVAANGVSVPMSLIAGDFPRLDRLFSEHEKSVSEYSRIALNPIRIARLNKVQSPYGMGLKPAERKSVALSMEFTGVVDRPGPVLFARRGDDGFRGLLQPSK